jgi:hypothetical protein
MASITHIRDWKAARQNPETYPGDRPSSSYLLLDEHIYPVHFDHPLDLQFYDGHDPRVVDEVLKKLNLPLVNDRYPIVSYGGNRNPATLYIKFLNYDYRSPGNGLAVPVLRGKISAADVVACGLSGQGYFYGDLLWNSQLTLKTEVEAWLALLDHDQLRVIHDSEGVKDGDYIVARFSGVTIDSFHKSISPMGYAGTAPVLTSPSLQLPLAFKSVEAKGRTLPEMSAVGMVEHLLEAFELREQVCLATGLRNQVDLPAELMKYMNRQWWHRFNSEQATKGYDRVLGLFTEKIKAHSLPESSAVRMAESGHALSTDEAYFPDQELTFSGLIGDC